MSSGARWTVQQVAALHASTTRELERLLGMVEGAPPATRDVARMAVDDAVRLGERIRYLRRQVEALGVDDELGGRLPPQDDNGPAVA